MIGRTWPKNAECGTELRGKNLFSEGNCYEILNEHKKFTSLCLEKSMVLFIPCKLNFLCSTSRASTGPGLVPGEPGNISALTNLDQECKVSSVIEVPILGYMQDPDFPQSHLVTHVVFTLSSCSSYQTNVPSNINLLCTQGSTYTLNTRRPALFALTKEVDSWRPSRFFIERVFDPSISFKTVLESLGKSQHNNPNALAPSMSFLLHISKCLGEMEISLFLMWSLES